MSCDEVEAAVAADEELLAGTAGAPRSQLLFNLARSLQARHRCEGPGQGSGSPDLDRAIDCLTEALEELPANVPVRKVVMSELAECLARRGRPDDTAAASRLSDDVLASMPAATLDRGIAAAAAAQVQYLQFVQKMQPEFIDEAIRLNEQAVADIPLSHPQGAVIRANLAIAMAMRFQVQKSMADLDFALRGFEELQSSAEGRQILKRPEFAANLSQLLNMGTLWSADEPLLARLRALAAAIGSEGTGTGPALTTALARDARAGELFLKYQRGGREQDLVDA